LEQTKVVAVAETPEVAGWLKEAAVPARQILGLVTAGLEASDYFQIDHRIRTLTLVVADVDPRSQVKNYVWAYDAPLGTEVVVIGEGAVAFKAGLESLGIPGPQIERLLEIRAGMEESFAGML